MEERNKKGKLEGRQGMGSRGLRTGNGSGDPHHFLGSRGVGGARVATGTGAGAGRKGTGCGRGPLLMLCVFSVKGP